MYVSTPYLRLEYYSVPLRTSIPNHPTLALPHTTSYSVQHTNRRVPSTTFIDRSIAVPASTDMHVSALLPCCPAALLLLPLSGRHPARRTEYVQVNLSQRRRLAEP
jgi:hypothetical protein